MFLSFKAKIGLLVSGLIVLNSVAQAREGGYSGGGADEYHPDFHVLSNAEDMKTLEEPFISTGSNSVWLHPDLIKELKLLGSLFVRYGAKQGLDHSDFFEREILNSDVIEYHSVMEFPKECDLFFAQWQEDEDQNHRPLACTIGAHTWIKEDLFKKRNIRQQALLILHERLHALAEGVAHLVIYDITDAMGYVVHYYFEQKAGIRVPLSDQALELIKNLPKRIVQAGLHNKKSGDGPYIEYTFLKKWHIHKSGGGFVSDTAQVHPKAFIGIGTMIGPKSTVGEGAVVIATNCSGLFRAQSLTLIREYQLTCRLQKNAQLIDSNLDLVSIDLDEGSSVVNSSIALEHFTVYAGWDETFNGSLTAKIGPHANLIQSNLRGLGKLELEEKAKIENFNMSLNEHGAIFPFGLVARTGASLANNGADLTVAPWPPMVLLPVGNPTLEVEAGTNIDLQNKSVCVNKSFWFWGYKTIKSASEFAEGCQ